MKNHFAIAALALMITAAPALAKDKHQQPGQIKSIAPAVTTPSMTPTLSQTPTQPQPAVEAKSAQEQAQLPKQQPKADSGEPTPEASH